GPPGFPWRPCSPSSATTSPRDSASPRSPNPDRSQVPHVRSGGWRRGRGGAPAGGGPPPPCAPPPAAGYAQGGRAGGRPPPPAPRRGPPARLALRIVVTNPGLDCSGPEQLRQRALHVGEIVEEQIGALRLQRLPRVLSGGHRHRDGAEVTRALDVPRRVADDH